MTHATQLLNIGARRNLGPRETMQIPATMICNDDSITGLIFTTYSHIDHPQNDYQYYLDQTILSKKNLNIEEINSEILHGFTKQERILQSTDSVNSNDGITKSLYLMEYLNSLRASSLSLAKLTLKIGVSVMLLRNLDLTKGLFNGMRMIVTHINTKVLRYQIISGDAKFSESTVVISRTNLDASKEELLITL